MGLKVDLDVMVDGPGNEKDNAGEFNHGEFKDPCPCNPLMMDVIDVEMNSSLPDGQQTQCLDNNQAADPEAEQNQVDVGVSCQEKVIKKPDKILPCPRCNSMDTKFCYYNNYNVNQPRHFCKSCQRYWTAGGTMRNVPVGAGKRKSKHSASHHRQLLISSSVAPGGGDELSSRQSVSCGVSSVVSVNGAGKFVKETISHGSVGKMTDPEEQMGKNGTTSKDHVENGKLSSENVPDCIKDGSSEKISQVSQNVSLPSCNGLPPMHPLQCYPGGPPWAYPWNPAWNNFAALTASGRCGFELVHGQENFNQQPFPWNSPQIVAAPAFCAPAIPLPFVPASFWGCMPSWPNGSWGMPWVGSPSNLTASTSTGNSGCSVNNSPLGKHSRQPTTGTEDKKEKSIWIPKTLRIDDPDEAAKSSIWATLGIKPGKIDPSANGGIFKGFKPQNRGGERQSDATHVLHANPAALCRSQTFQESS